MVAQRASGDAAFAGQRRLPRPRSGGDAAHHAPPTCAKTCGRTQNPGGRNPIGGIRMSRTLSRVQRDYDLGVVINPDVGDAQARAIVERITQTIATNGGQLVRVNAGGRRRLAYPIEHHRDGLYFFFDMSLPPEAPTEVERTLRVNEDIIRHLMLVLDPRLVRQTRQRE